MPENTVYVGRPSRYGNPFRVGYEVPDFFWGIFEQCDKQTYFVRNADVPDAAEASRLYEKYFPFVGTPFHLTEKDLERIAGKDLACWCREGEPCHADVLMKKANP